MLVETTHHRGHRHPCADGLDDPSRLGTSGPRGPGDQSNRPVEEEPGDLGDTPASAERHRDFQVPQPGHDLPEVDHDRDLHKIRLEPPEADPLCPWVSDPAAIQPQTPYGLPA